MPNRTQNTVMCANRGGVRRRVCPLRSFSRILEPDLPRRLGCISSSEIDALELLLLRRAVNPSANMALAVTHRPLYSAELGDRTLDSWEYPKHICFENHFNRVYFGPNNASIQKFKTPPGPERKPGDGSLTITYMFGTLKQHPVRQFRLTHRLLESVSYPNSPASTLTVTSSILYNFPAESLEI